MFSVHLTPSVGQLNFGRLAYFFEFFFACFLQDSKERKDTDLIPPPNWPNACECQRNPFLAAGYDLSVPIVHTLLCLVVTAGPRRPSTAAEPHPLHIALLHLLFRAACLCFFVCFWCFRMFQTTAAFSLGCPMFGSPKGHFVSFGRVAVVVVKNSVWEELFRKASIIFLQLTFPHSQ